jgi:hypothetical protein
MNFCRRRRGGSWVPHGMSLWLIDRVKERRDSESLLSLHLLSGRVGGTWMKPNFATEVSQETPLSARKVGLNRGMLLQSQWGESATQRIEQPSSHPSAVPRY